MDHRALEVFGRLLAAGPKPGWGSIHVAQESQDFFRVGSSRRIEWTFARYLRHASQLVEELSATWGPPAFLGAVEETPALAWAYWRGFRWMASWQREGQLAFVAVAHEDKELPINLLFGVK